LPELGALLRCYGMLLRLQDKDPPRPGDHLVRFKAE
jgi:hypothetical protein